MTHNVEELRAGIELLTKGADALKVKFIAYIADKSEPLKERWALFEAAPDSMKEHSSWYLDLEIAGEDVNWYDDFYLERHETMTAERLVEAMTGATSTDDYTTPRYQETDIDYVKEVLLAKNLGSFENDW